MDMWLVLYWGGPIGIGVFLAGLGVLFVGISHLLLADARKQK